MKNKQYRLTHSVDYLDPRPDVKYFDIWDELEDYITEEVERRVQWLVDYSPFAVSEKERQEMEENEWSLVVIDEV